MSNHASSENRPTFEIPSHYANGEVRLWDAVTGEQLLRWAGHTGGVALVSFSPDGTRLATTSADLTAKVWDLEAPAAAATGLWQSL